MARRHIRRARDGSYRLRLSRPERELLIALPAELERLLDEPENPDLRRLFPPAYDESEAQHEYAQLVGTDLLDGRRRALATIRETAGRSRLTPEEAEAWLTGLNALRLVLGTRLDVREGQPPSVDPIDPYARDAAVYLYLSYLQEQLVEAIASGLDPNAP
jgi:Domain of unknown function (DUF2017)